MTTSADDPAADLRDRYGDGPDLFPAYGDRCFADAPTTALSPLGRFGPGDPIGAALADVETDVDHVVFVLADGYGFEQWARDRARGRHRLHDTFDAAGAVTPLTSVYPSETAAAITSLHTGLPPAEHGLLGWYQRVEGVPGVVQTLPFATADGTPVAQAHPDARATPADLFAGDPLYGDLRDAGVEPHVFQPEGSVETGYTRAVTAGATRHGYGAVRGACRGACRVVEAASGHTYSLVYAPNVDGAAHRVGTDAPEYHDAVSTVLGAVQRELVDRLGSRAARRTLLCVSADHGLVGVDPAASVDLRRLAAWERFGLGERPPVGGPRNLQFHASEPESLREELATALDARVLTRREWSRRALFGPGGSDTFERRAPDVVAAPRRGLAWYTGEELGSRGMHGGLHPAEMLVPFAAGRVADLERA